MKKVNLIMIVVLLAGCKSAARGDVAKLEEDAHITIQLEDEKYAKELEELWKKQYPKKQDAITFVVEPYYFSQQLKKDIIWTNDIDAPYLKDQLQTTKGLSYAYEVPKQLLREELAGYYTPVYGEGLIFCYREDLLHKKHSGKEDLVSFEQMQQKQITYYHNHLGDYIYPFFADQFAVSTIPYEQLFPKEEMIKRLQDYKQLSIALNMPDDLLSQRDFYATNDYLCGLLSTKYWFEKQSVYQRGELRFAKMPKWQGKQLSPPFVTFGFAITTSCRYPKTAKQFLELTRSKEGIEAMLKAEVKTPILEPSAIADFSIYDYAKKELLSVIADCQLYDLEVIKENPGVSMEAVIHQSDLTSIIQNYVCSKESSSAAYHKLMKHLYAWIIGK